MWSLIMLTFGLCDRCSQVFYNWWCLMWSLIMLPLGLCDRLKKAW
jgi:hypothetical protein